MDNYIDNAIFRQICEVNDLDPETIRKIAREQESKESQGADEAERLIRTAFNYKAKQETKNLELGSTSDDGGIKEGKEYSISADPAAPSFKINEDFIHSKYSESEAEKLIDALGKVMMPVTG